MWFEGISRREAVWYVVFVIASLLSASVASLQPSPHLIINISEHELGVDCDCWEGEDSGRLEGGNFFVEQDIGACIDPPSALGHAGVNSGLGDSHLCHGSVGARRVLEAREPLGELFVVATGLKRIDVCPPLLPDPISSVRVPDANSTERLNDDIRSCNSAQSIGVISAVPSTVRAKAIAHVVVPDALRTRPDRKVRSEESMSAETAGLGLEDGLEVLRRRLGEGVPELPLNPVVGGRGVPGHLRGKR